MALLCIPQSEFVSFAFSTIPTCPFLILQEFFIYLFELGLVRDLRSKVSEMLPLRQFPSHLLHIALDIARFRLGDYIHSGKPVEKSSRQFLKVFFHSKGIEMVNLTCSSIVHSRKVRSTVPAFYKDREPPIISYKYSKPIGPTIFNFRQVAREHDINDPCSGLCTCKCSGSKFVYKPLGHVITGDLRIISSRKLRTLIAKGPNFREQNNIDWDLCYKLCLEGIDRYRKKWTSKEKVSLSTLSEWTCTVKSLLKRKIQCLRIRTQYTWKRHVLRDRKFKEALDKLHENYVLVPADKACNNVIVVCKHYYKQVLTKELTSSSTYSRRKERVEDLVEAHDSYMLEHNIAIPEDSLLLATKTT